MREMFSAQKFRFYNFTGEKFVFLGARGLKGKVVFNNRSEIHDMVW